MQNLHASYVAILFLSWLSGCTADPPGADDPGISDLRVDLNEEIQTIGVARWSTMAPARGRVHFRVDGEEHVTTWEEEAVEDHELFLLGMPADSTVELWAEVDDTTLEPSAILTLETGSPPPKLPLIDPVLDAGDLGGFFVVPVLYGGASDSQAYASNGAVIMLDGHGRFVWWKELPDLQPASARVSRDAAAILVLGFDELTRIPIDGSTPTVLSVPMANHDLYELPDGTIAALVDDSVDDLDGEPWRTSGIVEVQPDGTVMSTWRLKDHLDELQLVVGEGRTWADGALDHANALAWLPDTDQWLIGAPGIGGILRVDRATGATDWWIGTTPAATMQLLVPQDYLMHHRFDLEGSDLLWFVNRTDGSDCSRIARLDLNEADGEATEIESYLPGDCRTTFLLGQVQRLTEGRILVNWSSSAVLDLLDQDLGLQGSVEAQLGYGFGYADWLPDKNQVVESGG